MPSITLEQVDAAILQLLNGGQRVRIGNRTYERADLLQLRQLRKDVQDEAATVAATASNDTGVYLANFNHRRR